MSEITTPDSGHCIRPIIAITHMLVSFSRHILNVYCHIMSYSDSARPNNTRIGIYGDRILHLGY